MLLYAFNYQVNLLYRWTGCLNCLTHLYYVIGNLLIVESICYFARLRIPTNNFVEKKIEKKSKYDILANHLGQLHKMKTKIIPWVMTWDGIVTKTHKYYLKELEIGNIIEAYMQSLVIRKTLESISLDHRRGEEIIQEQPTEIVE